MPVKSIDSQAARSTFAIRDAATIRIVGRDLDGHFVSGNDTDEVLAHLAGDMCHHNVSALDFHAKLRIRERFDDGAFTRLTTDHGLFSNRIFSMATADDGSKWSGSFGGVARVKRFQ